MLNVTYPEHCREPSSVSSNVTSYNIQLCCWHRHSIFGLEDAMETSKEHSVGVFFFFSILLSTVCSRGSSQGSPCLAQHRRNQYAAGTPPVATNHCGYRPFRLTFQRMNENILRKSNKKKGKIFLSIGYRYGLVGRIHKHIIISIRCSFSLTRARSSK